MTTELLSKILDGGVRNINFFEGRLLTAKDLRDQQEADQKRHWQLGRAIGAGVVEGFEVEVEKDGSDGSVPIVKVKKGLAINAAGEALELTKEYVQVKLSRTLETLEPEGDLFFTCANPPESKQMPNGAGIYILAVSPTKGYEDYAPMTGLDDNGKVGSCGRRYKVDGLTFRLIGLEPQNLSERSISESTRKILQEDLLSSGNPAKVGETARLSKLRNIVAHLCFGTERLSQFPVDPFGSKNGTSDYRTYGALDELHETENGLTECDVPLALFYWTLGGIAFSDLWSVRRRPYEIIPSQGWPIAASQRRLAEAEATFFQFQSHLQQLLNEHTDPRSIKAEEYFCYLSPVGFLSLRKGTTDGPVPGTFFSILPHRPAPEFIGSFDQFMAENPQMIDGRALEEIIAKSFQHQPIKLPESNLVNLPPQEMVWLYYSWQHINTIKQGADIEHFLVFTTGQMPPYGISRFDTARWDLSNYARCCS